MKEILVYSIAGISSLVILGYSIHMFVGGLVDPATENAIIGVACGIGVIVMGLMVRDVLKRRQGQR